MGKPGLSRNFLEGSSRQRILAGGETRGSETSQYPEEKKPKGNSLSSGERKGKSPNQRDFLSGVVG
jgi:hypothetical protein